MALQAAFLLATAAAVATSSVHTFRATLYSLGGVCVTLGVVQSWAAYRLMQALPSVRAVPGWAALELLQRCAPQCRMRSSAGGPRMRRRPRRVCTRRRLQGELHSRWAAFIAGAAIYTAGTILLSFTGDAM